MDRITTIVRLMLGSKVSAVLLVLLSFFIAYKVQPVDGSDFRWYWTLGRCVLDGVDPYVPEIRNYYTRFHPVVFDIKQMGYPPTTGVVLMLFSMLKFSTSAILFKVVSYIVLVSGLIRLAADTPSKYSWGILGLVMLWSPVRWNSSNLQVTMIVAGLFCWFIHNIRAKRLVAAVLITLVALLLKVSDSLPFLIILSATFNFRAVIAVLIAFSALFVASFARVGGVSAFSNWVQDLRDFSHSGNPANAVSPHTIDAGIRIDIAYFLNGLFDGFPNASLYAIIIVTLVICVVLFKKISQWDKSLELIVFSTAIGLIPTYHHVYAWIYFAPIFVMYFNTEVTTQSQKINIPLWLLFVYGFTTATNETVSFLGRFFDHNSIVIYKMYPSFLAILIAVNSLISLYKQSISKPWCHAGNGS